MHNDYLWSQKNNPDGTFLSGKNHRGFMLLMKVCIMCRNAAESYQLPTLLTPNSTLYLSPHRRSSEY